MKRSPHPLPRILEHPQPCAVFLTLARIPRVLHGAEHALRVRHHDRKTPVRRGESGDALRRTVGVERVDFGGLAGVVHVAQRHQGLRGLQFFRIAKIGIAFTVRHDDGHAAARHAIEQNGS